MQLIVGFIWISTSAISALTNSVKGFSLKNSVEKKLWPQGLCPITGSEQALQPWSLSVKNSNSLWMSFSIKIGSLIKLILVVKLKGTSTVQHLISPQTFGLSIILQVLVAYSIFFLINPSINSIPVSGAHSWKNGIIRDWVKNTFFLIRLISIAGWSNVIVASTGIVMFISANTTGILTNTGPDLITTGVTGICLVNDCTLDVIVAQGSATHS